jgi:hypothetical protein
MSNLPPIDTSIDLLKDDIVARYQDVSREFSTLSNEVKSMTSVDTDRLTTIASELKVIIKKLDTINGLITRAQKSFKQKLIGLVGQIKTTGKNTSGSNQNLRNFINGINSRKGLFGFGTKWNITEAYKPPRIIDMTGILQRMTKLRNDVQSEVQANKARANQVEANRKQAEREAANAARAKSRRSMAVTDVGSLLAQASNKINAANKNISGGQNAAARKIQSAYRASRMA